MYYDPIYHPHCFPEIFESPSSVKQWIDSALNSHVSFCHACLSKGLKSSLRFLVQWQGSYFVVCSFLNSKLKQCTLSLTDLEQCNYTHCWLLSWLNGNLECLPLRPHVIQNLEAAADIFNIIANEDPKWLYYPDATYHLHLSQLFMSILAVAVRSCLQSSRQVISCVKEMYITCIIDHFIFEHNRYFSDSHIKFSANPHDNICQFVGCMELFYGQDIATLFREMLFTISPNVS